MLTDRTVKAKCCNYRRQWFISWKGNITCYFITNKPENAFFRFANEPFFYLLSYKSVMGMYSNNYYLILLPEKLLILIKKKCTGARVGPAKPLGVFFFKTFNCIFKDFAASPADRDLHNGHLYHNFFHYLL